MINASSGVKGKDVQITKEVAVPQEFETPETISRRSSVRLVNIRKAGESKRTANDSQLVWFDSAQLASKRPDDGIFVRVINSLYTDLDNPPDASVRDTIRMIPMKKGAMVFGRRNHIHGFVNITDKTVMMWLVWTPDTPEVTLKNYFESIAKPIFPGVRGARNNPIVQLKAVSEARDYGMMFSTDFWQYAETVEEGEPPFGKNLDGLIRLFESGKRD